MSQPLPTLGLAALLACGSASLAIAAPDAATAPTPLAAVASATPQFRMPTGEPQALLPVKPAPPAAAGPAGDSGTGKTGSPTSESGKPDEPGAKGAGPTAAPGSGAASSAAADLSSTARGEGRVSAEKPVAFVFRPESAGLYSIGVSSPQNAARIALFFGDSATPEAGTTPADGAIRWSSGLAAGVPVKIVVFTAGPEIPFRLEATGGPGTM
jgi:hypothetical protein